MQPESPSPETAQPIPAKKKGLHGPALFCLVFGIAFVVFAALLAGGFYLYTGSQYAKALASFDKQDFKGAALSLSHVADFYKDAKNLKVYAQAGEAMEKGSYEQARSLFGSLGEFRNAKEMLSEVDYREASGLLEAGKFYEASGIFSGLAQKGYKDSISMAKEADYRQAAAYYDSKDYKNALAAYEALGDYKDSPNKTKSLREEIYKQGIDLYRKSNYLSAGQSFDLIKGYERADDYIILIEAHGKKTADAVKDYTGMKELFKKLTALGFLEDANQLCVSNPFILFRLEGDWYWSDEKSTGHMRFYFDASKSKWFLNDFALDGVYYKIEKCILYSTENCVIWNELFEIKVSGENSMMVTTLPKLFFSKTMIFIRR